jgi:beta-glucuronidase
MKALAAALLLYPVSAWPAAFIQNAQARSGMSLAGSWQTIVDPYESGYLDYRDKPHKDGGYAANVKPKSKSDLIEYNFDAASPLQVPGDWNTQRPELLFYEGSVWYRRNFDYTRKPGRRIFVWFGAAADHAMVFLNGTRLGEHHGGFTPFEFEITDLLRNRDNFLIVKVDNQRRADQVPARMTDWWNYGGLTREVRLVDVPAAFIQDYALQLENGSSTHLAGWVQLNGARARQDVTMRIPEAGISKTFTTDESGRARIAFDVRVYLWSPERPKLYNVTVESGSDQVTDRIGFRTIQVSGQTILLNGAPLHLRGVSLQAEAPFRSGRAFGETDARTLLGWAKELDCNLVRLAHYPHDETMSRLADEMGLLVWSEVPVYWNIAWENPETLRGAEQQLTELIGRDKNRASVILWAVANETPVSAPRTKFIRALGALARTLDSTRLVTAAMQIHYLNPGTATVDDPLAADLDVVSCNEYIGWYDGTPQKIDRVEWNISSEKPFVISEFGADAQAGRHGDPTEIWTEEFQADVYRRQIAMFARMPFLSGTIAWVLMDFRSPRRPLAGIEDFFNRKGLYSDRGERKAAFDILRNYYKSLDAMSPLSVH